MFHLEKAMPWPELHDQLKEVPLLQQPGDSRPAIYPYANAEITLERVRYDEVYPKTLYVLRSNLATQENIAHDLGHAGVDPLELMGAITIAEDDLQPIGMMPPIIEEYEGKLGLIDGGHRACRGRWIGRTSFMGVVVRGVPEEYPPYALNNAWDDIRIHETVPPELSDRKHYVGPHYKSLYRDYSHIIKSGLRG